MTNTLIALWFLLGVFSYYVTVKATSPPNPVDGNIVLKLSSLSANISCRTLNTTTLKWETGDCEVRTFIIMKWR